MSLVGVINPVNGLSFPPVTQNTDGTAVTAGEINEYEVGLGSTSGNYTSLITDSNLTPDAKGTLDVPMSMLGALTAGQYYAAVRAHTLVGVVSLWSNEVAFGVAPVPKAVVGLAIS